MRGQQISPIVVQNPKGQTDEEPAPDTDRCLCCSEVMDTIGMCVWCAKEDCSARFQKECKRTGVVDPSNLSVNEL